MFYMSHTGIRSSTLILGRCGSGMERENMKCSSSVLFGDVWRNHILQQAIIRELELQLGSRVSIERCGVCMMIIVNVRTRKHLSKEFLRKAWNGGGWCEKRRRRQHCGSIPSKCCWTVVVMLPFICCDHSCWVLEWSLHSFLHGAFLTSASVVTPALINP